MWALDALQGAEDAAVNNPPRIDREQTGDSRSAGKRRKYGEVGAALDGSAREDGF